MPETAARVHPYWYGTGYGPSARYLGVLTVKRETVTIAAMSGFSLADLCDLADVTPRTVRYYITQGLLRPPTGAGPAARYEDGHLYRLRLIRRLQREHLPLAEIRRRLDALSDADVERLTTEPGPVTDSAVAYVARVLGSHGVGGTRPQPAPVPRSGPPAEGMTAVPGDRVRSQWERITITPEIELHVRRPLSRDQNRRVDRLLETARTLFVEDVE